jgi:hypothetical protein
MFRMGWNADSRTSNVAQESVGTAFVDGKED